MSYNVENFFDTEDDPTHDDDSFLPTGEHHWTHARYQTKIQHIAEVISTVGGEAFPDLIALMEVENATVLSPPPYYPRGEGRLPPYHHARRG